MNRVSRRFFLLELSFKSDYGLALNVYIDWNYRSSGALGQAFTSDQFGRRGSILAPANPSLRYLRVGSLQDSGRRSHVRYRTALQRRNFPQGSAWCRSGVVPASSHHGYLHQLRYRSWYPFNLEVGVVANPQMLLSGIFFLPESPRHLLGTGRIEEDGKVIAELNSVPVHDTIVEETIEELMFGIRAENEGGKATWPGCFSTRNDLWRRTLNGMMLQFIQQLNGQNFYYYYGDTFFKSAGTKLSPFVIQTILGAVSVAGTLPAPSWVYLGEILPPSCLSQIHRIGKRHELVLELYAFILLAPHYRRPLILMSFFGMLVYGYIYVYFFIPETKGFSLEDRAHVKPWKSTEWKPRLLDHAHDEKRRTTRMYQTCTDRYFGERIECNTRRLGHVRYANLVSIEGRRPMLDVYRTYGVVAQCAAIHSVRSLQPRKYPILGKALKFLFQGVAHMTRAIK
ncbi:hypothetical protein CPB85DRAFT_1257856 [Mucidula mucida]|nr:hypothetical protein CPB85DRAFT_1257856 [Mucidula mucida]